MALTHVMLGNAAVAAVLALLALAVGCACRSPAVRHIAWVLVLLKLVTPPLVRIPLPVLPASWGALAAGGWWDSIRAAEVAQWAIGAWIAGAAGWFLWQGRQIIRFRRRVLRAEDAGPEIAAVANHLAKALGIARPPAVKATTGIGSPMLWGWGRGTVVLFPRALLERLAPEARDTLLAHELAHFLRRDHWVRVLEFIATGLYWWHPAVWLARAGIEAAEEECCDTWVVGGLAASPRRYAEALLMTVDFIAELRRPCLPPGTCAANRASRLLHRRLIGIIHANRPSRLRAAVAVMVVILAASSAQPVLRTATLAPRPSPETVVVETSPVSLPSSPPPRPVEPPAWATAASPGGALTVLARDHEVVLRRPDRTETVLAPGKPVAVAFAPDGKRLATAGPGPLVRTWNENGCFVAKACGSAAARSAVYTPDGTYLLVLDAAGDISVRDPNTLAAVTVWSVGPLANSITCSADGRTVAVAFGSWLDADSGWVECWSIPEWQKLATYRVSAPIGATRFTPDGRTLVVGGWSGWLAWLRLPEGELVADRQLSKDLVAAAAFSPDAGTLPLKPPNELLPPPRPEPRMIPALRQAVGQLPKR